MTQQEPPSDKHIPKTVNLFRHFALAIGFVFFAYSANAATFLGGGSTRIFMGVAFLSMMLGSCFLTGRLMQAIHQL